MATHAKVRDESSRAISSILLGVLEACRQGDVELIDELGLSIETIKRLDTLKADQIHNISGNYMRDEPLRNFFNINSEKMTKIINIAAEDARQYEMIDEFLERGACKRMMGELFGMRSTQVANRKKYLNLPTIKGRLTICSIEEQERIYDAWLATIETPDFRERLLSVARTTNLTLSKIYREVLNIESIKNQSNSKKSCACA
jgi:hypothetical protein